MSLTNRAPAWRGYRNCPCSRRTTCPAKLFERRRKADVPSLAKRNAPLRGAATETAHVLVLTGLQSLSDNYHRAVSSPMRVQFGVICDYVHSVKTLRFYSTENSEEPRL